MNIFDGVEFNTMRFILPLIILGITMVLIGFLYSRLFKWLPKGLYNSLMGPTILLLGGYLWIFPMNMGFYEFFK